MISIRDEIIMKSQIIYFIINELKLFMIIEHKLNELRNSRNKD